MHMCMDVCLCMYYCCVSMTMTAESASALEGLTSGLHEIEMGTLFTYQKQTNKQRKQTNKQTGKGGHMSLDFCGCFYIQAEMMWT